MSTQNPLQKHFRTPAIYIRLPSNGDYWPEESLDLPVTGEVGVLPMTTTDEIAIRTPDALLNGQSVVDVINSCIPSIRNAWDMPSIDVDTALMAIRIASYSPKMEIESKCPHCSDTSQYEVDLNSLIASVKTPDYKTPVAINGLTFKFKPQKYFDVNRVQLAHFEEQKMLKTLTDVTLTDTEKALQFKKHVNSLIALNHQLYASGTESITIDNNVVVTNPDYILEYYTNADRKVTAQVKEIFDQFGAINKIAPVSVVCAECEKSFSIAITFDYSTFFA